MTARKGGFEKRRQRDGANGFGRYFLCLLFSFAILTAVSLLASAACYLTSNPIESVGIFSLVAVVLSAAVTGGTISVYHGTGGFKLALLSAFGTVLIMLAIAAICSGGKPAASALMNYICYVGVTLPSAYLMRPRERRHRFHRG